jgi:NAD(P)-dependent dehydrogenase (short-subunit alcohol dehydrogenase family)
MTDDGLAGTVALVTGAAGALGAASARLLAARWPTRRRSTGCLGLLHGAAVYGGPLGIRVNAVAPQLIDTAKNRPYLSPELLAHAVSPEAIADLIVYLVSDEATPVSGAVLPAYGA